MFKSLNFSKVFSSLRILCNFKFPILAFFRTLNQLKFSIEKSLCSSQVASWIHSTFTKVGGTAKVVRVGKSCNTQINRFPKFGDAPKFFFVLNLRSPEVLEPLSYKYRLTLFLIHLKPFVLNMNTKNCCILLIKLQEITF